MSSNHFETKSPPTSHLICRRVLRCHELDPGDHLASFYLGYQLARARQVGQALSHVRTALQRRPDHLSSLHLLALLLTAENRHSAALEVRRCRGVGDRSCVALRRERQEMA